MKSEAELREEFLLDAAEVYRSTFVEGFIAATRGGRIPGVAELPEEEARDFFRETSPETWQQITRKNPEQGYRLLQEFIRSEQKAGWAG